MPNSPMLTKAKPQSYDVEGLDARRRETITNTVRIELIKCVKRYPPLGRSYGGVAVID